MARRSAVEPNSNCQPRTSDTFPSPTPPTDTLELKAEKKDAHSNWVRSVAFSPDGKTIASGSYDKTLKVWGTRSLSQLPQPTCLLTAQ